MQGKRLTIILSISIALSIAAIILVIFLFLHIRNRPPRMPPDLTGEWIQTDIDGLDYYHIASVRDGLISVYRYRPAYDDSELIWIGTCPPPQTPKEPYKWDSENRVPHNQKSIYTLRNDTLAFRYEKGLICFDISFNAILKMAVTMERWGTPSQFDNPQSPNNNISGEIAPPDEVPAA